MTTDRTSDHTTDRDRLSARPGRRRLGGGALVGLALAVSTLTGCGTPDQYAAAAVPAGGCPAEISRLVDPGVVPAAEIDLVVDGSGSFLGREPAAPDYVARQLSAAVDRAIDQRAALRVLVFAASAGDAVSAVECPVLAARVHNEAARPAKVTRLRETARREVLAAVLAARPTMTKPGTSVVGGYIALADAPPLSGGTATPVPRIGVMLSDGIALPESEVPVDLAGFDQVSMYGVGHSERPLSTGKIQRLTDQWRSWLKSHHARRPTVSTQPYLG